MFSSYTLDSALLLAAQAKKYDLMKSYLEKGATCSKKNSNGNTVVHMAIINQDEKMLDLLLNYQIDLSIRNSTNLTPVGLAASSGRWKDVRKIVSKHHESNYGEYAYSEAMLLAAQNDDVDSVRALLLAGAKPSAVNPVTHDSALHYAVFHRNLRMIRLLMRYPAEMWRSNSQHMRPIEYAASLGNWDCVMLLAVMSKGQDSRYVDNYGNILMLALRKEYYQHVGALLVAGASPDFTDPITHETPLHFAVRENNPAMVAMLMKYKANADRTNAEGMTPLFLAHQLQHWECADAIVNPEKYLSLTESSLQKKLFYLFTAHKNKENPFSGIPYDVLKIIFKQAFDNYPAGTYDFNQARQRYENFREERNYLGSVSFFVQAYQSFGFLRQWTTGQSVESIAFVDVLSDIIRSGDVLQGQVAAAKAEIAKFTALKGETKSRAMDLLKQYQLFTPVDNKETHVNNKGNGQVSRRP